MKSHYLDRVKRIWYLSPMRAAKVLASLRIRSVSPEPSLLAHTSSESRGTFRQKTRSLAPLNGWACAVKVCHDGMLEDTNSFDGAHLLLADLHLQPSYSYMRCCKGRVLTVIRCFFFQQPLNRRSTVTFSRAFFWLMYYLHEKRILIILWMHTFA